MARAELKSKDIFNPEEAVEFYRLSRRKFKKMLSGKSPFRSLPSTGSGN